MKYRLNVGEEGLLLEIPASMLPLFCFEIECAEIDVGMPGAIVVDGDGSEELAEHSGFEIAKAGRELISLAPIGLVDESVGLLLFDE